MFFVNKDLTYRKISFNTEETPPATHNVSGTALSAGNQGLIKIIGKQPGEVKVKFRLKHKQTQAEKEIEKTISVKETPLIFSITELETIDYYGNIFPAISMNGGYMHTQMTARFKIKVSSGEFNIPVTVKIEADNSDIYVSVGGRSPGNTEFIALYDREYTVSITSNTKSVGYVSVPIKITLQKGAHLAIQSVQTGEYRAMAYVPGTVKYHTVSREGVFPRSETFNHTITSVHQNVYIRSTTVRVCKSSLLIVRDRSRYRSFTIMSQTHHIIDNWGYLYKQSYQYIDGWNITTNINVDKDYACSFY
jgi:hypothetical protein